MTSLNSALPEDIRIIGWAPVSQSFSARYGTVYYNNVRNQLFMRESVSEEVKNCKSRRK